MRHSKLLIAGSLLGTMLLAVPAFADVAPIDACSADSVGERCDNAGENADALGVCIKDTCSRATPDGPMSYECYVCQASSAAGDNAGKDDDGCSMSAVPVGGLAGIVAPLLAFGLAIAHRRRARHG